MFCLPSSRQFISRRATIIDTKTNTIQTKKGGDGDEEEEEIKVLAAEMFVKL